MVKNERTKYVTSGDGRKYRVITEENPDKQETKVTQNAFSQMDIKRSTQYLEETAPQVTLTTVGTLIEPVIAAVKKAKIHNEYSSNPLLREGDFILSEQDLDNLSKIFYGIASHGAFALAIIIQLTQQSYSLIQSPAHFSHYFAIASTKEKAAWNEIIPSYIKTIAQTFPNDQLGQLRALLDVWKQHQEFKIHIGGTKRGLKSGVPSFDPDRLREKLWKNEREVTGEIFGQSTTLDEELEKMLPTLLVVAKEYASNFVLDQTLLEPTVRLELKNLAHRLIVSVRLDAIVHQGQDQQKTITIEIKSLKSGYEYAFKDGQLDLELLLPEHRLELLLQSLATLVLRQRFFTATTKEKNAIKKSNNNAVHHKIDISSNTTYDEFSQSNWDQLFEKIQLVELHLVLLNPQNKNQPHTLIPITFDNRDTFDKTMTHLTTIIDELHDYETRALLEQAVARYLTLTPKFEIPNTLPTQNALL